MLEAAAAQVRASALETRTRELEVALTDVEIRLAAAVEAETRAGGSLVAQREVRADACIESRGGNTPHTSHTAPM